MMKMTKQERTAEALRELLVVTDHYAVKMVLLYEVEKAHVGLDQYDGMWARWRLARVTQRVETKAGLAFEVGDLVLVDPKWRSAGWRMAYSWRNGVNTSIQGKYLDEECPYCGSVNGLGDHGTSERWCVDCKAV